MPKYPFVPPSKLPRTGMTIFSKMSALAQEQGALNLSQGFPGFDAPERLKEMVAQAVMEGANQYAPMQGILALREAVAKQREADHGTAYHPDKEVTITAGATQAIFTAVNALVRENDEVIIFTPAYDCYAPAVELAGGKPIYVKLKAPNYTVDWEEVKKVVNRKTRMIIVNTPHNPTATVWSKKDLRELARIVEGTEMIVLSDEVYEYMVFDEGAHLSPAGLKELAGQTLVVGSFGKSFHATGWKVGYVVGPAELMAEFRKVHQYNVFCVNHPMQLALARFMEEVPQHLSELSAFYQQKRDLFLEGLKGSRFTFTPAAGTYFQLLNYQAITREEDLPLAERWTNNGGVASIPVSVFYHAPVQNGVLRFCFAKSDEELKKAAARLIELSEA